MQAADNRLLAIYAAAWWSANTGAHISRLLLPEDRRQSRRTRPAPA